MSNEKQAISQLAEWIEQGKTQEAIALLKQSPELADSATDSGVSLLVLAHYFRQTEVASSILANKNQPLDVFESAVVGDRRRLRAIIQSDPAQIDALSADGFSPLHLSAFFDRPEAARILLANGAQADLAATNAQGVYPIHSAAASRSTRMVRLLLAAGADPDSQQAGGYTALHSAAKHGNVSMVKTLLASGASIDINTDDGATARDFLDSEQPELLRLFEQQ